MSNDQNNKSILQRLWDRRFFQYLATYLGISWGFIQFSEWLVTRYGLDSEFIDKGLIFLFAILPSVTLLIYFHGRVGDDEWKPFEKILYPANLLVAFIAAFFLIDGSAQVRTQQIKYTSEAGDTITRIVPKAEYTKRIVFFPFTSELEETEKWMEIGLPILADVDIEQDMQWYGLRPTSLGSEFEDYGYKYLDDVPFSAKIKIAEDLYCDLFATGNIKKANGIYSVDLKIIETKTGKEIYSNRLESENIYGLADQVSTAVTEKSRNKNFDAKISFVDLPSSDLISNNEKALEAYIKSITLSRSGIDNYPEASSIIDQALALDPLCAECYSLKSQIMNGMSKDGNEYAKKALEHSSNLPERQQLSHKYNNYLASSESAKSVKLLEAWKKLYPQDVFPFDRLIFLNSVALNYTGALEIAQEAQEAGHSGRILLTSADIATKANKFDLASKYVNEFETKYPEKAKKETLVGDIHFAKGDYQKAVDQYEQNSIMNPNNVEVIAKLAQATFMQLKLDEGLDIYNDAFSAARNYRDTLIIIDNQLGVFVKFGMADEFEKGINTSKAIVYRNMPKGAFIQYLIAAGGIYATIGEKDKVNKVKEEILSSLPPQAQAMFIPLLEYLDALWNKDGEKFEANWEKVKPIISGSAGETGLLSAELMRNYFKKDWEKTLEYSNKLAAVSGATAAELATLAAECYIELDRADDGLDYVEKQLINYPNTPSLLFARFNLLDKLGEKKEGKKMIPLLDKVFSKTHPNWEYLVEYIKIKDTLTS